MGHLHGKRSLAVDQTIGDRWRTYLLDTLLGDQRSASQLLDLFAADKSLGLVFAEDRHSVGWSENYELGMALANRLDPPLPLRPFPYFPLGTMVWARPAALEPLWQLGLGLEDFPPEPAPYDGTVLHAMDWMIPSVCEAAGFSWCTVYAQIESW